MNISVEQAIDPRLRAEEIAKLAASVQPAAMAAARESLKQARLAAIQSSSPRPTGSPHPQSPQLVSFPTADEPKSPKFDPNMLPPSSAGLTMFGAGAAPSPLVSETLDHMDIPLTRPASNSTPGRPNSPHGPIPHTQFAGSAVSGPGSPHHSAVDDSATTSGSVGLMSSSALAAITGRAPSMSVRGRGPKRPGQVQTRPPSLSVLGRAASGLTGIQQPPPGKPGHDSRAASYLGQTFQIEELPVQPLTPLSPHSPPETPVYKGPKKMGKRFSDRSGMFGSPTSQGSSPEQPVSPPPDLSLDTHRRTASELAASKLNRLGAALTAAGASGGSSGSGGRDGSFGLDAHGRDSPQTPDNVPARTTHIHTRGGSADAAAGMLDGDKQPETPPEVARREAERAHAIVQARFGREAKERKRAEPIPYAEALSSANGGAPRPMTADPPSTIVVPAMPRLAQTRPPSVSTAKPQPAANIASRNSLTVPGNAASMKSRPPSSSKRAGSEISLQIDENSQLPPPSVPLKPLDLITGTATTPRNSDRSIKSPRAAAQADAEARLRAAAATIDGGMKGIIPPASPQTPSSAQPLLSLSGDGNSQPSSPAIEPMLSHGESKQSLLIDVGPSSAGRTAAGIEIRAASPKHAHTGGASDKGLQIPPGKTGTAGGEGEVEGDGDGGDMAEGDAHTPEPSSKKDAEPVEPDRNRCGCTEVRACVWVCGYCKR